MKVRIRYMNGRAMSRGSVPASVAKRHLDDIAHGNGGELTPQLVVRKARDKASALHKCFEWDDGRAAEEFRVLQARDLIRSVYVQVDDKPEYAAFVSVQRGRQRVYMEFPAVMGDEQLRQSLLEEAVEYIDSFKERFRRLKELAPVIKAIDRVLKKVRPKGRKAA